MKQLKIDEINQQNNEKRPFFEQLAQLASEASFLLIDSFFAPFGKPQHFIPINLVLYRLIPFFIVTVICLTVFEVLLYLRLTVCNISYAAVFVPIWIQAFLWLISSSFLVRDGDQPPPAYVETVSSTGIGNNLPKGEQTRSSKLFWNVRAKIIVSGMSVLIFIAVHLTLLLLFNRLYVQFDRENDPYHDFREKIEDNLTQVSAVLAPVIVFLALLIVFIVGWHVVQAVGLHFGSSQRKSNFPRRSFGALLFFVVLVLLALIFCALLSSKIDNNGTASWWVVFSPLFCLDTVIVSIALGNVLVVWKRSKLMDEKEKDTGNLRYQSMLYRKNTHFLPAKHSTQTATYASSLKANEMPNEEHFKQPVFTLITSIVVLFCTIWLSVSHINICLVLTLPHQQLISIFIPLWFASFSILSRAIIKKIWDILMKRTQLRN